MLVQVAGQLKTKVEYIGPGLAAHEPKERYVNDDKAELWFIYQQLQAGIRAGSPTKLQEAARRLTDRLALRFQQAQSAPHNLDTPAQ